MSYMKGKLKTLGGEINMKGKLSILGNIGLALFLVCALMLTVLPAAKVEAATAVTEVWVEFDDTNSRNSVGLTTNEYIIHFKPTTALERFTDWVTITFPDGTTTMGGSGSTYAFSISGTVAAADLEFSTNYGTKAIGSPTFKRSTSNATTGGYRIKIKCPFDYAAGTDVWMKISSTSITAAATAGDSYKVKVSTTKDTTGVLSSTFSLGHATTVLTSVSASVAPATAGATGQYTITFTPATTLTASSGTVTVRFPVGTTLPSSMTASNVEVKEYGGSFTACGVTPTVDPDRRIVKITTPVELDADDADEVKFLAAAGITNPTIADDSGDYYVGVRTSGDREWVVAGSDHDITAGAATKLAVANKEIGKPSDAYSDDATMINMLSSYIYIYLADSNGNAVTPASAVTVTPSSSAGTGTFYTNSNATPGSGTYSSITSITLDAQDPADAGQQIYYRDTAAGTYTLTFAATGYTSATWTITVAPAVSLYDAADALVNTYGATSTSPVAEIAAASGTGATQKYASDYINDAITAAMAGDTVKLGDGTYEVDNDSYISLNKAATLTSVNGASSTTIRNTAEIDKAILVGTDGAAATPVIIDGFTFQRLRSAVDIDSAVRNAGGYDYVTVRNCIFNNIQPDASTTTEAVIWFTNADTITSATISNNTFNDCVTAWPDFSGAKSGSIVFDVAAGLGNGAVSGVTISGNTLTDCYHYGILVSGESGATFTGTVKDNTVTNGYSSLNVSDYIGTSGLVMTGNTVTGACGYGIKIEGGNNGPITIKNNTITGTAGSSTSYALRIEHDPLSGTHYVQYNDIYDNTGYSIRLDTGVGDEYTEIDCKYNWYGDASGPSYTALTGAKVTKSNPNGTGDPIYDRVVYYPWLHKSRADVVADNVSYQTSTMKLVSGWNTLSTPVKLIAAADSVDELIPSGMTIGYYYDGGWQQITSGYVLNPCDAVYAKMSAVTYAQLKFDAGAFNAPSKDLAAGWNLMSLAYLSSSGKTDLATVASVAKTAANLPGYAQLVSPSLNATQTDMYGTAGTSWAYAYGEATANSCYAGLGYWVYMQNAATLAGFEITPIAPDLD
ncbi:right-handed parallel beta-helix repeat-containing protein [Chloroflexota bacterium]